MQIFSRSVFKGTFTACKLAYAQVTRLERFKIIVHNMIREKCPIKKMWNRILESKMHKSVTKSKQNIYIIVLSQ